MLRFIPDKPYIQMYYFAKFKKFINFNNPKTFNEKLQWLKFNHRNPEYTKMVDKYEAKKYVANIIGEEYIIPTLGVWEKFEDIDFGKLPNQFVLKCTHDSGGLVICKDKSKLDIEQAREKINRCMNTNFFYIGREYPYKNVKPRIIAEEYMDLEGQNGEEYKIFCSNGETKIILLCKGVAHSYTPGSRTNDYFDANFNRLPVVSLNPNSKGEVVCPNEMPEMKRLAEKLSVNIPILRVDFYLMNGKIYFGELTFFHNSGISRFEPDEYDSIFGNLFTLPDKQ